MFAFNDVCMDSETESAINNVYKELKRRELRSYIALKPPKSCQIMTPDRADSEKRNYVRIDLFPLHRARAQIW